MSDVSVTLGSVTLQGMELPVEIPFGGEQATKVHRLLGGARVIDALGRDDMELAWNGRLQGSDAEARADALDQLRIGGQAITLTWGTRTYTVVVTRFTAVWQRKYQIPYSIVCTVQADNSSASSPGVSTTDDLVDGDMSAVDGLVPSIEDPTILPAVSGLESAISAVGTLQGASLSVLGPVATAAQSCNAVINTSLGVLDAATLTNAGSVAGVVAGAFAPATIATFLGQVDAIEQQATLQQISSLTRRVQTNIAQATG